MCPLLLFFLFFFNDTATTEIYTLSLHDALPIIVFFKRLHLQSGFRSELLGQRQSLFGFVNIEPGERGIPTYGAPVAIERCAFGLGIELLALALEPTLIGARQLLTQSDGEFSEVVAT